MIHFGDGIRDRMAICGVVSTHQNQNHTTEEQLYSLFQKAVVFVFEGTLYTFSALYKALSVVHNLEYGETIEKSELNQ